MTLSMFDKAKRHGLLSGLLMLAISSSAGAGTRTNQSRTALAEFGAVCLAQQWADCHRAWFDLFAAELEVTSDRESGDDVIRSPQQAQTTGRYAAITEQLERPSLRGAWDAVVMPLSHPDDPRAGVPARLGLLDAAIKREALDLAGERLHRRHIAYHVHDVLRGDRAEWLRYLTLVYIARDDETSARKALLMLGREKAVPASKFRALQNVVIQYFGPHAN